MGIDNRISNVRNEALKRIEKAARGGDTKAILSYTKIVEESEQLKNRLEAIVAALEVLEKKADSPLELDRISIRSPLKIPAEKDEGDERVSPRLRADRRRRQLIEQLNSMGITLRQKSGSLYETASGGLVGIAYASERQPNRWFLGLPSKDYHCVVLLCEKESGELSSFVLPGAVYQSLKDQFSQSGGQVKFNLTLRGGRYLMTVPRLEPITLNEFQDNYDPFKLPVVEIKGE